MMDLSLQKKLAAKILGVGWSKVWVDPAKAKEIKESITKADIRVLIQKGYVKKKTPNLRSRARVRVSKEQKKKGRQRGTGSRKGRAGARTNKKQAWMSKIRIQRKFLGILKEKGIIENDVWRKLYRMAKGGFFRSKEHLKLYAQKAGLLKVKK